MCSWSAEIVMFFIIPEAARSVVSADGRSLPY